MTFCVCRLCKDHGHDFIKDVNGHPYFTQINIRGVRKMLKVWICDKCHYELMNIYDRLAYARKMENERKYKEGLKNEN